MRKLWRKLLWLLPWLVGPFLVNCSPAQLESVRAVTAVVAPVVDPLLRVIGFCRDNKAPPDRVAEIVSAYKSGDKLGAAMKAALLLEELRAAGIEVPRDVALDMVETVAAVEGLQRGLRALSCRDPNDGSPIPGCV